MFLFFQYIPHGHCYLWQTPLVWLHISTDFLIAIAYYSIPITLFYFVRRQQDNPFEKIIVLFSWFIFSCGTTHLMSIWTLWHPDYWVSGAIKVVTALISVYTAIELIEFFPFALSLPNPTVLERANQDLAAEIESRKQIELELEKERLFLKAILDNLSVGVVACDETGVMALSNRASQKIFNSSQSASQEWTKHHNLYYPDGKTYLEGKNVPFAKALAGETFADYEIINIAEDSQTRHLVTNGCPIVDDKGKKFGAVVTLRDVTKRKQAEIQLTQLNAELLQSNRELEQFAYVASHDLREPLRMVISFTQLLSQRYGGKLDNEADTIIGFAVDGAKRMEVLIEDLLLYSRLGKRERNFKLVDCNEIANQALSNLQILIQDNQAQISMSSLPQLVGDEVQLTQLFQNLIHNAIIYRSDRAKPEIAIAARALASGWEFSIEDNGIGIDPKNAARIFEVFQRLHTREKYAGTGVGLAICKKIVERHGGKIWAESTLGFGSVFRFTLNSQSTGIM